MSGERGFAGPPHLAGEANLRAWFTEPAGALVQMVKPSRGTREMAEWLVGAAFDRLRERFPNDTNLILVMDFSLMEGRDPIARSIMMDKARECRELFARSFIVPPLKASPIYMTALHAAAALLTAFGVNLGIERSLEDVLAKCPLKPLGS
jgi:hypothetical protein